MAAGLLNYALAFFVLAIVMGIVGLKGIAGLTMSIAKWFVIIFIILALVTLIL